LVVAIVLLALAFAVFAQENNETAQEATESETVSPTDADSIDTTEENDEAMPDEAEPPSPAEEAFQRAMQHEEKSELEEAIADCTEAIRLDPDNLEYLNGRAHLYGEMRNQEKAMADAAKILELDPTNLRARVLRGRMLELSGDPEKALIEFNTAVQQNPTSLQALSERQYYFIRQGQDDKAKADANRMVQLQPDSATGNVARALSGRADEAMNYASAAIQQDPENWYAYKLRGLSRAVNGDFAGAKSDFEKALELSPDNARIFSARGAMHYMHGDYEESLADAQRAADLEPRNCAILALLADRLATCPDSNLRNATKASEYAAEALKLDPNEPLVWRACASSAAANGNFEEAKKWQERVVNSNILSPDQKADGQERLLAYNSGQPYVQKLPAVDEVLADKKIRQAHEAIRNGNFDRAIALLSEVIAADVANARAYSDRGFAFFEHKDYERAITDFTRAIEISSKDSDSYFYRARSFEKTKQYGKARDDLLKTYDLDPDNAMGVQNNLAWFLATCPDNNIRDGAKAAEHIDRALELHPDYAPIWDTCAAVFAENGEFDEAIEWEKAYVDRKDLSEEQRNNGKTRLELYEQHQPYREELQPDQQLTASTTPAQPEK